MLSSQLEEIFARRVFPCLDHPSKKAIFTIEYVIDENLIGISNTSVKEEISLEDGKKKIIFNKTPKMSTYLLYFGVGDFEIKQGKNSNGNTNAVNEMHYYVLCLTFLPIDMENS